LVHVWLDKVELAFTWLGRFGVDDMMNDGVAACVEEGSWQMRAGILYCIFLLRDLTLVGHF